MVKSLFYVSFVDPNKLGQHVSKQYQPDPVTPVTSVGTEPVQSGNLSGIEGEFYEPSFLRRVYCTPSAPKGYCTPSAPKG